MKKIVIVMFCLLFSVIQHSCSQQDDNRDLGNFLIYPPNDIEISTHSAWTRNHYPSRIAEFKNNRLEFGDIVFLGNSITEQAGSWRDRLVIRNAKNRGIAGDTTEGVIARLGEIFYYKPEKVFILIGINDLFHPSMTPQSIAENIVEIVNKIKQYSPSTDIFVQTVLPTTTTSLIESINSVNAILENAQSEHPYSFIQLHEHFVLEDGKMNMAYSTDGVHLNEQGYQLWTELIQSKL